MRRCAHAGLASKRRWLVLQRHAIATAKSPVKATGLAAATVNKSRAHLARLGLIGLLGSAAFSRTCVVSASGPQS